MVRAFSQAFCTTALASATAATVVCAAFANAAGQPTLYSIWSGNISSSRAAVIAGSRAAVFASQALEQQALGARQCDGLNCQELLRTTKVSAMPARDIKAILSSLSLQTVTCCFSKLKRLVAPQEEHKQQESKYPKRSQGCELIRTQDTWCVLQARPSLQKLQESPAHATQAGRNKADPRVRTDPRTRHPPEGVSCQQG